MDYNKDDIRGRLHEIARERGVRILYAVESGSRAWGVESPDSDWDIRFIYMRGDPQLPDYAFSPKPYLRLFPPRDVIELTEGDLDFSGWDIVKALRLAATSNPSIVEWFRAEWTYFEAHPFTSEMRRILADQFSPRSLMHHYVSLANRQYRAYWHEGEQVRLKKYIYAVRPLLAVRWMAENNHRAPPLEFGRLVSELDLGQEFVNEVSAMLDVKSVGTERDAGRFDRLDHFIVEGIQSGRELSDEAPARSPDRVELQAVFHSMFALQEEHSK